MAGRGVHEARAGVVGDMVAVKQGNVEVIAGDGGGERVRANKPRQFGRGDICQPFILSDLGGFEDFLGELVGEHKGLANLRPVTLGRVHDPI